LWASCREILNINHAKSCGTDIITVGPEFLKKFKKLKNYNLKKFSKETAKMFYDDATSSNFKI
jgi:transaldolase